MVETHELRNMTLIGEQEIGVVALCPCYVKEGAGGGGLFVYLLRGTV